MTIVKKTVAIHPIFDVYVRKTWSMLIDQGFDATYSTALNYMLLGQILSLIEQPYSKKIHNDLQSFLSDSASVEELNIEDYAENLDSLIESRKKNQDMK
ncbi:hypothetical protein [Nitrosopumilus sp.]|uniref:hypothetical protein n=1 Tax=Nitrosopumilus sp. TaxID=2024843 RepID=UPI002625AEBC|nr:hypothetical protein [Nitrosopumilus sp.]